MTGPFGVATSLALAATPNPILTPVPVPSVHMGPNRGVVVAPHVVTTLASTNWTMGEWLGYGALLLLAVGLTVIAVTTLSWMLHAWRTAGPLVRTGFPDDPFAPRNTFTLLVPGRRAGLAIGMTLDKLAEQDHPGFEIIAIVGNDDPATERAARDAAGRHPELIRVVVDESVLKNKPTGLTRGLASATGEIVGVFDARDDVHPHLLTRIDSYFTETDADVVQGDVQVMNLRSSWWSLRNAVENYFWFRSQLPHHASSRFVPLGGTTVFVRKEWLDWSEGWDVDSLDENSELGVRLSRGGAKVAVAYIPDVVTREKAPQSIASLFTQRARRDQGLLQVLGKGELRNLPTLRRRIFARYLLAIPFLQAITGVLVPLLVVLVIVVKLPVVIALIVIVPLAPTIVTVVVEVAGLAEFGRLYSQKVRARDYVSFVLGTYPYQVFLMLAALVAVARNVKNVASWRRTVRTVEHRNHNRGSSSNPGSSEVSTAGRPTIGSRARSHVLANSRASQ